MLGRRCIGSTDLLFFDTPGIIQSSLVEDPSMMCSIASVPKKPKKKGSPSPEKQLAKVAESTIQPLDAILAVSRLELK